MGTMNGVNAVFALMACLVLALARTASTTPVPGLTAITSQDAGRRMLVGQNSAAPPQTTPHLTTNRRLHQEHECPDDETWIHCNSATLCWGIGRGAPSTECGSMDLCVSMCNTAMQNGGQCAELWNEPSQSYYYSIQYEGAVFCDPPGGGSGGKGGGKGGKKGRKLSAATKPSPAATITAAAAAKPTAAAGQVASSASAVGLAKRQLLQEHVCYDDEFWIHCNSQPLCWGIGRGAPSTECGPAWMCESMCNTARQNGGQCAKLWNPPSNSFYYSINYQGAVFCDPPRGGSGSKGGKKGRKLSAATKPGPAATAATASAAKPVAAAGQVASSASAVGLAKRQLLQEHVCYDDEFWIHCNSVPLCWGIGRGAPSTECGPAWMCESMCNTAQQSGGQCAKLWNAPSNSFYYSINYQGAVFCDPPGSGGNGGGPRRPRPRPNGL